MKNKNSIFNVAESASLEGCTLVCVVNSYRREISLYRVVSTADPSNPSSLSWWHTFGSLNSYVTFASASLDLSRVYTHFSPYINEDFC